MRLSGRDDRRQAGWRLAAVLLSSLVFLWLAVVNGGPYLFEDTVQYTRGPDGALGKFLGPQAKSDWSIPRPITEGTPRAETASDKALASTPRAGRSIYYGLLANIGARTGGFWLTMFLQAVIASLSLDLLCKAMGWRSIRAYLLTAAAAAFTTTLPVYVDFVMPDVFAAILLICAAAVAAGGERLARHDLIVATLVIAYCAMTHTSHMAILAAVLLGAAVLWLVRRGKPAAQAPAILAAISVLSLAVAGLATASYSLLVQKAYHARPIEIPFLTARIVSFGHPGADWLKKNCPQSGFTVCKVKDRLPMTTNEFIWSVLPVEKSAFTSASPHDQAAMGAEQWRFFFAVAMDRPVETAKAFLFDTWDQIADFSLLGMNVEDDQRIYLDSLVPQSYEPVFQHTLAYRKGWPTDQLTQALGVLCLLSLAALALLAVQRRGGRVDDGQARGRLLSATVIVLLGILANAAACGGLSGVFGRYEARALPPLILLGWFALAVLVRRKRQPA